MAVDEAESALADACRDCDAADAARVPCCKTREYIETHKVHCTFHTRRARVPARLYVEVTSMQGPLPPPRAQVELGREWCTAW